ncbi:MAG: AbgT family transporter [Verrucomicrobia bacterium]|nr:AbgT family transporter [Verrucomicrobiota bacterium]
MSASPPDATPRPRSLLDWIESVGNRLPEPPILFAGLTALVILLSAVGHGLGWTVRPVKPVVETVTVTDGTGTPVSRPVLDAEGRPVVRLVETGASLAPRSLLTGEGVYWMFSSLLRNFTGMPALGLIFVAMLGIGLAEKFGFFSALMRGVAFLTPRRWLTPVIVFVGANSSVASDAGYIILPPLAAALFLAAGRHPVAGLAAAFAGVAGGFGGGLFPTGGDGVLTGFAQDAAHVIDPTYSVTILHNLYFKVASAAVVTLAAWWMTDRVIEPRLLRVAPGEAAGDPAAAAGMGLGAKEKRALFIALATMAGVLAVFAALIFTPGSPLHGVGQPALANGRVIVHQAVVVGEPTPAALAAAPSDRVLARDPLLVTAQAGAGRLAEAPGARWSQVIVPIIFLSFLVPGLVYGRLTGHLNSQKDAIEGLYHGIRSIVPVLAILFFLAQFVNAFAYSNLDRMLAYAGGSLLFEAALPIPLLLVLFVGVVILGDFAMSGMLSKFGVLAPIFIPMFMMVGISPELTTAAYRIGDSVVNIITPLNSYLLIILAVFQKYRAGAGLGSLMALMVPYSVGLGVIWTLALLVWYALGLPLGPGAPLHFSPAG